MSDQTTRLVLSAVLLLHGLGHGGALGALVWLRMGPGSNTGAWRAARSWLLLGLSEERAALFATAFWIVSMVGFVATAAAFSGFLLLGDAWRSLAVGSAVVSATGIVLFFGTWPIFNTLAALGVNVAVLVALLALHWHPGTI